MMNSTDVNTSLNAFAQHLYSRVVESQNGKYEQHHSGNSIITISAREHCEYILCSREPIYRPINDIGWMSWKHKIPITPSTSFT